MEENITISKKEYKKLLQIKIGFISSIILDELSKYVDGDDCNEERIEELEKQQEEIRELIQSL